MKIPKDIIDPYSLFGLMDKLYEAKKYYYNTGSTTMTDDEYDRLESTIKVIHGEDKFRELYCVGYDNNKHKHIKDQLKIAKEAMEHFINTK